MIGGLLLYLAIMLPLYIAFENSISQGRHIFEGILDGVFIMDVFLTFITGFRDYN